MFPQKLPKKSDENLKKRFVDTCKFCNHDKNLCCGKVFTGVKNINSIKHHYQIKKDFYSHLNVEDILIQITHTQKQFVKF